jgi:hypothetical protein
MAPQWARGTGESARRARVKPMLGSTLATTSIGAMRTPTAMLASMPAPTVLLARRAWRRLTAW